MLLPAKHFLQEDQATAVAHAIADLAAPLGKAGSRTARARAPFSTSRGSPRSGNGISTRSKSRGRVVRRERVARLLQDVADVVARGDVNQREQLHLGFARELGGLARRRVAGLAARSGSASAKLASWTRSCASWAASRVISHGAVSPVTTTLRPGEAAHHLLGRTWPVRPRPPRRAGACRGRGRAGDAELGAQRGVEAPGPRCPRPARSRARGIRCSAWKSAPRSRHGEPPRPASSSTSSTSYAMAAEDPPKGARTGR